MNWVWALSDDDEGLVEFDWLAVLDENGFDDAGVICLDLIHHFHRLNDANYIAGLYVFADFNERGRRGRGRTVESAYHWRFHSIRRRGRGGARGRSTRCRRSCRRWRCGLRHLIGYGLRLDRAGTAADSN